MKKRQWRIRPVFLIMFACSTGLLLLITCLLFYWNFSNNVVKQVVGNRLELIDQTHGQISSRLRELEETALVIASNPNLIEAFGESGAEDAYDLFQTRRESVNNLVNPFLYSKPYLSSIRLFNDRFKHLPRSSLDRVFPYSDIEWDRTALDRSDSFWLGSHPDPVDQYQQKNVVSYVRKIFNSNGRVVGVVEMNMAEESLSELLKGARRTYSGIMFLTDSGGRIVSRLGSFPEEQSPERAAKLDWLEDIHRAQSDGYRVVDVEGTSFVVIYSYPKKSQWRLIEMIPAEQMYHPVKQIRNFVVLIALAGLLATIFVAYYLSGRMTRQVPELVSAFRRVQGGHFDASISESHSIFEYRQVAISFNRMVGELTASIESREKEQRAEREAEFRVLENQINPHFLYNTLDMINWMAAAKGANEASLMSAKLAKLFRLSLNKGRSFITVAEEMEHGAIYSQIQQARFKESFVYEEEMDPAVARLLVPKLILQPFIENAIVHGFRGRSADRAFRIRVSASLDAGRELRFVVEDNGRGLDSEEVPGPEKGGGHGMANVNQRIQLHFGPAYGAKLGSRDEGGARLEIRLPALTRIPDGKGGE